jgi:hypothetical protein
MEALCGASGATETPAGAALGNLSCNNNIVAALQQGTLKFKINSANCENILRACAFRSLIVSNSQKGGNCA